MRKGDRFASFASASSRAAGHPAAFLGAGAIILLWLASGPIFGFSDTWQLVVNTGTTIVTFLMVFLIQNTQNRDAHAMQIKLDELIRVVPGANEVLLDLEELGDAEIDKIRSKYQERAEQAREGKNPDIEPLE